MEGNTKLLSEFYQQNIEVKMLSSNEEIDFMKRAFKSDEFAHDGEIAVAASEHFGESTSIIFFIIYIIHILYFKGIFRKRFLSLFY